MPTIKAFIKKYPVLTYFALTFAISWGGVLILGGHHGMPATSEQFEQLWPIVFLPYFLGPSMASILLIGLVDGRSGYRELISRLLRWRVGARWYAVALLTVPLLLTPILFALSQISPAFLPGILTTADRVSLTLTGVVVGLVFGGLLEELGWTGFAVPRLRRRFGVFTTGLIVGVLWGVWHFLPTFWGSGDPSGALDLPLLLPGIFFHYAGLPAYRLLMVWVYDRTESLLVAMLMHASLSANMFFILAPSVEGGSLFTFYLAVSAALWVVVAAAVAVNCGQVSLPSLHRRVA